MPTNLPRALSQHSTNKVHMLCLVLATDCLANTSLAQYGAFKSISHDLADTLRSATTGNLHLIIMKKGNFQTESNTQIPQVSYVISCSPTICNNHVCTYFHPQLRNVETVDALHISHVGGSNQSLWNELLCSLLVAGVRSPLSMSRDGWAIEWAHKS